MHLWLYNSDIVLEIFTLVDKYSESKKIKKPVQCSAICAPLSLSPPRLQHKVVLQSISLAEVFSSLWWSVLRFCVWASLIYMDKDKNRLSLADTDFLFYSMIFLYVNISKDLWTFTALFPVAPCTWKLAKPSSDMKQIFMYLPSDWDFFAWISKKFRLLLYKAQ